MKIRADLTERAFVDTATIDWVASPAVGVDRKMLDRDGAEVARATSLVRYAPASAFPPHEHGGGEEFLVLGGTFCDEHGAYPAGTYVRNPIGSVHAPSVPDGCVILVKLRQMSEPEERRTVIDTTQASWEPDESGAFEVAPLFEAEEAGERVRLERWRAGASLHRQYTGGFEMLVLEGELRDEDGTYRAGAWLRLPAGSQHTLESPEGAKAWVKTGHL